MTTTRKCDVCHTVHGSSPGPKLLPRQTLRDTCLFCHDGTGGYGVYGTIAARGFTVEAAHRIDATNTIPGGSATTGGSRVQAFEGQATNMTCSDCHSPHGAGVVQAFSGERVRFHASDLNWLSQWSSTKILTQRPTGADTSVTVYGSDWCAGCHKGRSSGGMVVNHPVDSRAVTTTPFHYDNVAIVTTGTSLTTTMGSLGLIGTLPNMIWHNRGLVMPYPRTAEQQGHYPICQQCHEDAREVGEPGAVVWAQVYRYGDGRKEDSATPTDSPLFQTFPHESQATNFLVEAEDNLCQNCHPVSMLP